MDERIGDLIQAEDDFAEAEIPIRRALAQAEHIICTTDDPTKRIMAIEAREHLIEAAQSGSEIPNLTISATVAANTQIQVPSGNIVTLAQPSNDAVDAYANYVSLNLNSVAGITAQTVTTQTVSMSVNMNEYGRLSIGFSDPKKELKPDILQKINRPDRRSWMRLPMGIEYTYHLMRHNYGPWYDDNNDIAKTVQKEIESILKGQHGTRIYTDGPCLEMASPVHKNWKSMERWYKQADKIAKSKKMIPWRKKAGGGGAHVNVTMPADRDFALKFMRNLLVDVANKPYLNWMFNEPSDDHTANCLWTSSDFVNFYEDPTWEKLSEVNNKSYAIRVKETGLEHNDIGLNIARSWLFEMDTPSTRDAIADGIAGPNPVPEEKEKEKFNNKPGFFELRFFDMPRNKRDLLDLVKFVNSYMNWIWKLTEDGTIIKKDRRIQSRRRTVKEPEFVTHMRGVIARRRSERHARYIERTERNLEQLASRTDGNLDVITEAPTHRDAAEELGLVPRTTEQLQDEQMIERSEIRRDLEVAIESIERADDVIAGILGVPSENMGLATANEEETLRIAEQVGFAEVPDPDTSGNSDMVSLRAAMERHIQSHMERTQSQLQYVTPTYGEISHPVVNENPCADLPVPDYRQTQPTRRVRDEKTFPKNYHRLFARTAHGEFKDLLSKLGLKHENYRRFIERNFQVKMRKPYTKKYFT